MNLKSYLENNIVDFELNKNAIENYKDLFDNKTIGLRTFFSKYASYIINYKDKLVTMTNIFEENFKELKAFKLICGHYGFKFEVALLDFINIPSKRDRIIQTMKYHVTMAKILENKKLRKNVKNSYNKLINSKSVINETKKNIENYYAFQFSTTNIKEPVVSRM
jgi:hypothetical protein